MKDNAKHEALVREVVREIAALVGEYEARIAKLEAQGAELSGIVTRQGESLGAHAAEAACLKADREETARERDAALAELRAAREKLEESRGLATQYLPIAKRLLAWAPRLELDGSATGSAILVKAEKTLDDLVAQVHERQAKLADALDRLTRSVDDHDLTKQKLKVRTDELDRLLEEAAGYKRARVAMEEHWESLPWARAATLARSLDISCSGVEIFVRLLDWTDEALRVLTFKRFAAAAESAGLMLTHEALVQTWIQFSKGLALPKSEYEGSLFAAAAKAASAEAHTRLASAPGA